MLEGCVSSWVAKQEYEAFAGRVVEGPSYRRYGGIVRAKRNR